MSNLLLETTGTKVIFDLLSIPGIIDCKEPRYKLLAIIFQNSFGAKNSKRVKEI
jgi:hypothetical protein